MIDQLRTMAIFQSVAELGSFRQAAKKLHLSPSVVSHHISQLEDQLGLPLLYRSTRRMSLTDAGAELLVASQRMTAAAQEGLSAINRRVEQPVGTLSITISTALSHSPYVETYTRFARAYPGIQLSIHLNDRSVSLEGAEFDVAIRGRNRDLDDSSYIARKLGHVQFCFFASPEYVRGRSLLKSIDDLADWDRIQNPPIPWRVAAMTEDGTAPQREPRIAMSCDNHTMARKFVDEGLGFMVDTYPLVADDIRTGRLVHLLPGVRLRPFDIYAIYPANSPRDGLARLFVDFMLEQDWTVEYGFGPR